MNPDITILKPNPTITEMFQYCNAPLKNTRWSWGAVSVNNDIFLRVWENELAVIEEKRFYRVTHLAVYKDKMSHPGIRERLDHVERIGSGSPSFMIKCRAKNPRAIPREFKDFDVSHIGVGGKLIDIEGDKWLEQKNIINLKNN